MSISRCPGPQPGLAMRAGVADVDNRSSYPNGSANEKSDGDCLTKVRRWVSQSLARSHNSYHGRRPAETGRERSRLTERAPWLFNGQVNPHEAIQYNSLYRAYSSIAHLQYQDTKKTGTTGSGRLSLSPRQMTLFIRQAIRSSLDSRHPG